MLGGDPLPGQKLKPRHSGYPKGIGGEAPAWVAFDRQVQFNKMLKCSCRCLPVSPCTRIANFSDNK